MTFHYYFGPCNVNFRMLIVNDSRSPVLYSEVCHNKLIVRLPYTLRSNWKMHAATCWVKRVESTAFWSYLRVKHEGERGGDHDASIIDFWNATSDVAFLRKLLFDNPRGSSDGDRSQSQNFESFPFHSLKRENNHTPPATVLVGLKISKNKRLHEIKIAGK